MYHYTIFLALNDSSYRETLRSTGVAALHHLRHISCPSYLPWSYVLISLCFSSSKHVRKSTVVTRALLALLGLHDQVVGCSCGQGPGCASPFGPLAHMQVGRVAGGQRQPGSCFAHVPTQGPSLFPVQVVAGFSPSRRLEKELLGGR